MILFAFLAFSLIAYNSAEKPPKKTTAEIVKQRELLPGDNK